MEAGSEARRMSDEDPMVRKILRAILIVILGLFVFAGLVFGSCLLS